MLVSGPTKSERNRAPTSGKVHEVSKALDIPQLSTGDMLREVRRLVTGLTRWSSWGWRGGGGRGFSGFGGLFGDSTRVF